MSETVSKTDNFLKAIEKYAEEQRSKRRSEAEEFKERELNAAEEQGLREAYDLIQKKMADINNEISSELSQAESSSRKRIFMKRRSIEDLVFEKAGKKLLDFTSTDKYIKLLQKSASELREYITADDAVLYVKQNDMKHEKKLKEAFGAPCRVEASADIRIGGIIGLSRSMGLIADETLDTRFEHQREWFHEHSGLTVTEQ